MKKIIIYTDGGSRGNPGKAGSQKGGRSLLYACVYCRLHRKKYGWKTLRKQNTQTN